MAKISILEQRGNENYFSELGIIQPTKKKSPKSKNRKKNYRGGNYEVRLDIGLIRGKKFLQGLKSPLALYLLLRSNIVRGEMNDGLDIKNKYYDNRMLACSYSYRYLGRAFGVSHITARNYIKILEELGAIKIHKIKIKKNEYRNVYILGSWSLPEKEIYYIDNVCSGQ